MKYVYSAVKTWQLRFEFPTPPRHGSNSPPPGYGQQSNTRGSPGGREVVETLNWFTFYVTLSVTSAQVAKRLVIVRVLEGWWLSQLAVRIQPTTSFPRRLFPRRSDHTTFLINLPQLDLNRLIMSCETRKFSRSLQVTCEEELYFSYNFSDRWPIFQLNVTLFSVLKLHPLYYT